MTIQRISSDSGAPNAPTGERAKLAAAARQFEAIFIRQILASARESGFGGGPFGSQASQTFAQMRDERVADIAAQRGAFGLAGAIERQLAGLVAPIAPSPAGKG